MKGLANIPLLVPVTVLCLGLVSGEAWLLHRAQVETAQALAALKQKRQEHEWLVRQSPALSPGNEAAVSAELAAAKQSLAAWRSALQGDEAGRMAAAAPGRSIEAFFQLTDFVEQLRAKARQAQVALRPDERFGFAAHANEGPVADQIAVVHRQRLAMQDLVEMLFEARPLALLSVRRERPGMSEAAGQRQGTDDFLELDRAFRVRQPGQVESDAFRLDFTGPTSTLRQFLNCLGSCRQPVVVRTVEVEPAMIDDPARRPAAARTGDAAVSLVQPRPLKFAVTIELVRLADNPAPP